MTEAPPASGRSVRARGWLRPAQGGARLLEEPHFRNRRITIGGDLPESLEELPLEVDGRCNSDSRKLLVSDFRILSPVDLLDDRPRRTLDELRTNIPADSLVAGSTPGSTQLLRAIDRLTDTGRIRGRTRLTLYPGTRVLVVVADDPAELDDLESVLRRAADPSEARNIVVRPARWHRQAEATAEFLLDGISDELMVATGRGLTGHGDIGLTLRTVDSLDAETVAELGRLPDGLVEHTQWIEPR